MAWRNRLPILVTLAMIDCSSDVTQSMHFPHSVLSGLAISSIQNTLFFYLHHQLTLTIFSAPPYPCDLIQYLMHKMFEMNLTSFVQLPT